MSIKECILNNKIKRIYLDHSDRDNGFQAFIFQVNAFFIL